MRYTEVRKEIFIGFSPKVMLDDISDDQEDEPERQVDQFQTQNQSVFLRKTRRCFQIFAPHIPPEEQEEKK